MVDLMEGGLGRYGDKGEGQKYEFKTYTDY